MNLLPSEVSLQMRFDAFCKKVITYTNCYAKDRKGENRAMYFLILRRVSWNNIIILTIHIRHWR